jgi:hypothetical protein
MKFSTLTLCCGLALASLFALAPSARADLIPWTYNWSRSPNQIHADAPGTGYITLTDESLHTAVGDSDVVATNMRTFSTALPTNPDHFTAAPYALTLTLGDVDSGKTGALTFTGQIDGDLGAQFSRLHNTFTGPASQSIVLGNHRYVASNLTFTPPGVPGATNAGSISAHVTITVEQVPEPASWLLLALGVGGLALRRLRRRSRAGTA